MLLHEMTWQEIDRLDRSTIVLVPFGAMEQHGPHLPLETDSLIATELARRVDEECNRRLLVAPTQWLGLSTHHMGYCGTISASVESYLTLAKEIIGSIAQSGFQKILVLNAHGGNVAALDVVLTKCRDLYPRTRIVLVTYWNAAVEGLSAIRESHPGGMGHACELETSLMLAAKPAVVRTDRMQADGRWSQSEFLGKDMLLGGAASVSRSFRDITENGAVGDPRTSSPEKGERFFRAIVSRITELVRDLESGKIDSFRTVTSESRH